MSILTWIEDKKRRNLLNAPNYVARSADASKGLWTRCDKCGVILYIKHLKENQRVCFGCSYHLQMMSQERIENLLDKVPSTSSRSSSSCRAVPLGQKGGRQESLRSRTPRSSYRDDIVSTWRPLDETLSPCDPLKFHDQKNYTDRLKDAQERTGLQDAIQTGTGMIDGIPVALAVMDFSFMGGSMGSVVGEKITRLIEYATAEGLTLLIVSASGGARMQEGVFSLMQMAKVSSALQIYQSCAKLLYISILTSPTTGGVTASFAMLGDIIFAEPKALIAFAGRRVIEQTLAEDLPEDFQTSESMLHHGLVDLIVPRRFLRQALSETIRLYQNAPFKKVGIIPFGVQNPISFLAEEKVRRQWSPLTKLGTKQFVQDASKDREEKKRTSTCPCRAPSEIPVLAPSPKVLGHGVLEQVGACKSKIGKGTAHVDVRQGAYREILTSFEMMLDLFRSGKGIKMGVTDLTTQKEQGYLTLKGNRTPAKQIERKIINGNGTFAVPCSLASGLSSHNLPLRGLVRARTLVLLGKGFEQQKGRKELSYKSFRPYLPLFSPTSPCRAPSGQVGARQSSCLLPQRGTGQGKGARRGAVRTAKICTQISLPFAPEGQRAYPFGVRQLPVPIFDWQRGTYCKGSMANCKGSRELYSKTTRVFLRQNVSAVAEQSAQNGTSPTNRALSFSAGENNVKNSCRFFNGVQKRLYRRLAQNVYNLKLQNRDDSVNKNGAVPCRAPARPCAPTCPGGARQKGSVLPLPGYGQGQEGAKKNNSSARNAFPTSISVPIFFSMQPFDLQSGLPYKSSYLAEQSKKVGTPIGLANRKLALARKLVGENARPLQKENKYKKRILFSKDVALFVANKKWTRDLPGSFSSVSSRESMPYKSSRVPCVLLKGNYLPSLDVPLRGKKGHGTASGNKYPPYKSSICTPVSYAPGSYEERQRHENGQRGAHVKGDTTRTVSKAFQKGAETNIACKMENRFTLLHNFRSFSERLASNKLSREEKNDNRFPQAPKENLPSRANFPCQSRRRTATQIKDLRGQVLQARQNKISDFSGKNADINFLNRAIELAATDSVEWRAFYIHQQLSENMSFLEEFLQQDQSSRRKNGNLLFYKSICRTQKALDA